MRERETRTQLKTQTFSPDRAESRRGRPLWRPAGLRSNPTHHGSPQGTTPTRAEEPIEEPQKGDNPTREEPQALFLDAPEFPIASETSRAPHQEEPAGPPAVEIHRLKKSYALKPVLRGIDLTLRQGERVALLGANGAGKTTVLRILAGLARPDGGSVTVLGRDIVEDAQEIRRCVGLVAHQPYLYEELSARENLLFFSRMYAVPQAHERVNELLQRLGLEKRMHDRVRALSRGLIQRVAWARALLHRPHLLLLDEPDTGLDQSGVALIDTLLAEHRALGGSILFTTHLLERALAQSDRIVLLSGGRVAYRGVSAVLTLPELQRIYREVCG